MPGLTSFFQAFRQLMRGTKNGERKNSGEKRREKTRLYNFACNISTNGGQRKHVNLENCLLYLSSIMSQFLDFINCLVFDFTFFCVTMNTLLPRMFVLYVKILNLRVDLDTATWQSLVHTQINFMNVSKTSLCQLPMKSLLTIHGVINV